MFRAASYLATDGTLLMAIPAFAPAIVIAGVVIVVAARNRRHPAEPSDGEVDS